VGRSFRLGFGLGHGILRSSRGAIRRTTSAPPGAKHPAGPDPKARLSRPSHRSNAPIRNESQSFLRKKIALLDPIGISNPLSPARKSRILKQKILLAELCRYFRRLALANAGVGH